jgi:hypothetical protein
MVCSLVLISFGLSLCASLTCVPAYELSTMNTLMPFLTCGEIHTMLDTPSSVSINHTSRNILGIYESDPSRLPPKLLKNSAYACSMSNISCLNCSSLSSSEAFIPLSSISLPNFHETIDMSRANLCRESTYQETIFPLPSQSLLLLKRA